MVSRNLTIAKIQKLKKSEKSKQIIYVHAKVTDKSKKKLKTEKIKN